MTKTNCLARVIVCAFTSLPSAGISITQQQYTDIVKELKGGRYAQGEGTLNMLRQMRDTILDAPVVSFPFLDGRLNSCVRACSVVAAHPPTTQ